MTSTSFQNLTLLRALGSDPAIARASRLLQPPLRAALQRRLSTPRPPLYPPQCTARESGGFQCELSLGHTGDHHISIATIVRALRCPTTHVV